MLTECGKFYNLTKADDCTGFATLIRSTAHFFEADISRNSSKVLRNHNKSGFFHTYMRAGLYVFFKSIALVDYKFTLLNGLSSLQGYFETMTMLLQIAED